MKYQSKLIEKEKKNNPSIIDYSPKYCFCGDEACEIIAVGEDIFELSPPYIYFDKKELLDPAIKGTFIKGRVPVENLPKVVKLYLNYESDPILFGNFTYQSMNNTVQQYNSMNNTVQQYNSMNNTVQQYDSMNNTVQQNSQFQIGDISSPYDDNEEQLFKDSVSILNDFFHV